MTVADGNYPADVPPIPRLASRICHVTDLVIGAKIDEKDARYVPLDNHSFGYIRIGVPEGTEVGEEITLTVKARVVT